MSLQALNRARLNLGRELLKAYPDILKLRNTLDRWIEGIISSPGISENGRVMGGLPKYVQERLLERKEADPYYQQLSRDIEIVESAMQSLSDEKKFLADMFYWRNRKWWELCGIIGCSKSTLYDWIDEIDTVVVREWVARNESPE